MRGRGAIRTGVTAGLMAALAFAPMVGAPARAFGTGAYLFAPLFELARDCTYSPIEKLREAETMLIDKRQALERAFANESLELGASWRIGDQLRAARSARAIEISVLQGSAVSRPSAGNSPALQAANTRYRTVLDQMANRLRLVGEVKSAENDMAYYRLGGPSQDGYFDVARAVERARRALADDERATGLTTAQMRGVLAAAQVDVHQAAEPAMTTGQAARLGELYVQDLADQQTGVELAVHVQDLRRSLRESAVALRYLESWEPQIKGCLASRTNGPAIAVAGAAPVNTGNPGRVDPAGPPGSVRASALFAEWTPLGGRVHFAGTNQMEITFHPGGDIDGSLRGGGTLKGRWGGGQGKGSINLVPSGRTARFRFEGLRFDKAANGTWTLATPGTWCALEVGTTEEDVASGNYFRFYGYILPPGAPEPTAPPPNPERLCSGF